MSNPRDSPVSSSSSSSFSVSSILGTVCIVSALVWASRFTRAAPSRAENARYMRSHMEFNVKDFVEKKPANRNTLNHFNSQTNQSQNSHNASNSASSDSSSASSNSSSSSTDSARLSRARTSFDEYLYEFIRQRDPSAVQNSQLRSRLLREFLNSKAGDAHFAQTNAGAGSYSSSGWEQKSEKFDYYKRFREDKQKHRNGGETTRGSRKNEEIVKAEKILGIKQTTDSDSSDAADRDVRLESIKSAFKQRALLTHPDIEGGSEAEFKQLLSAYQLLLKFEGEKSNKLTQ